MKIFPALTVHRDKDHSSGGDGFARKAKSMTASCMYKALKVFPMFYEDNNYDEKSIMVDSGASHHMVRSRKQVQKRQLIEPKSIVLGN